MFIRFIYLPFLPFVMHNLRIIFFIFISSVAQAVFCQSLDTVTVKSYSFKNEIGIDGEFEKSIISLYYLMYLDKKNKYTVFAQIGGPLTPNAHKNFAVSVGSMWHLKPTGKSLTVGLKFYYEHIRQEGEFFDNVGLEYYTKKGYELSIAPEVGYTFLLHDKIRIYPYLVPFAYSYVVGTDTRTVSYNSTVQVSDLSDEQGTISQSGGIKVGIRF
tara:strand:+ start:396 stop:1037 length:642 start_codon:yes stop_codon:yes gene_type:complete